MKLETGNLKPAFVVLGFVVALETRNWFLLFLKLE